MAEIFLSYRRDDSASATGRLADALEAHFGDERVFRDHEIAAGEDFVEAIRRSVESATVVLAIVGMRWLDVPDVEGRRRLDDPADFVRLEIELALRARVAVVPVLVEGATMPAEADLPPSLAEFSRCQAVELSDHRWRADADRLIEALQSRFAIDSEPAPLAARSTGGAAVLTRVAADLIELAIHPRRLIARRQTGRASDHAHAVAFLAGAIVVGNVILHMGIDLPARGDRPQALVLPTMTGWLCRHIRRLRLRRTARRPPRPRLADRRPPRPLSPGRADRCLRLRRRLGRPLHRRDASRRRRAAGRSRVHRPCGRCAQCRRDVDGGVAAAADDPELPRHSARRAGGRAGAARLRNHRRGPRLGNRRLGSVPSVVRRDAMAGVGGDFALGGEHRRTALARPASRLGRVSLRSESSLRGRKARAARPQRSMRAIALCAWIDSKFSTSTV
jgi:hypothetical protein